jgi:hypothetical protein
MKDCQINAAVCLLLLRACAPRLAAFRNDAPTGNRRGRLGIGLRARSSGRGTVLGRQWHELEHCWDGPAQLGREPAVLRGLDRIDAAPRLHIGTQHVLARR